MKKPLLIGALAGILITAGLALFLKEKDLLTGGGVVTSNAALERDPEVAPLMTTLSQFVPSFPGSEDVLMHRAMVLRPRTTIQAWEKVMSESGLPVNQRTSSGCRVAELSRSLTIRPEQVQPIMSGQTNVLFIPNNITRCFSTQNKATLVVEDLLSAKSVYELPGVVSIERLVELPMSEVRPEVLWALGVSREDLPYVVFGNRGLVNLSLNMTVIHFALLPEKPLLDARKIPSFMAGVEGIRPTSLQTYLQELENPIPPVLVDVRDARHRSAGMLPGAIQAPMIAADVSQLRFLLDAPLRSIAGARFDTSKLPEVSNTPLILFGNDDQDASVVWAARNMRLLGYRRVFFIIGGLEALKREAPNFRR